jgi:catecholate siderophore receptor
MKLNEGGERKLAKAALQIMALGVSGLALTSGMANAQQVAENDANTVSGVTVQVQQEDAGISRLPQAIEDMPQTVHVIDAQTLREQAATSLDRAVRNIPGITADTGEGGGSVAGDQFRVRGFSSANDIATDGLRDFGVYTRDTFNTESVQVFLGPSGATFGRGSFGGAINQSSKFATLDDASTIQGTVGTADLYRFTADVNHQLSDTSAMRVNVLLHHNEVADIDELETDRFGFAAAAGWGLGTDTSLQVMYFHQQEDRMPYYGVPVVSRTTDAVPQPGAPTGVGGPVPVDRSTFYGDSIDRDNTQADVLTARFEHRVNNGFKINNDTRYGVFDREFLTVAPSCSSNGAGNCAANFLDGNPATVPLVTRGGANGPYYLQQWGVQNITTATADFEAFGFKQQFVAGVDATYEHAQRRNTSAFVDVGQTAPVRPVADGYNPDPSDFDGAQFGNTNTRESQSRDIAFFASEQFWLTDQFSILASARWDEYDASSTLFTYNCISTGATGTCAGGAGTTGTLRDPNTAPLDSRISNSLFSPRISAIWEPAEHSIIYASWARSEQPATGTALASVGTPIDASADVQALDPTSSETTEIGARFPLFTDALLLGVSVFRTERDNAKTIDPDGVVTASGDQQEVKGIEVSLSGQITERWAIDASYTYLDTETAFATGACTTTPANVRYSTPACNGAPNGTAVANPAVIGNPIPFAAEHAATLWTTYSATPKLIFGFGARYADSVFTNNTNTAAVPEYISYDGMITYLFDNGFSLQLNGTNLADRDENYDQAASSRAAHAPGRAFTLSLTKNF